MTNDARRKGLGWLFATRGRRPNFYIYLLFIFYFFTNTRLPRGAILSAGLAFAHPLAAAKTSKAPDENIRF